MPDFLQYSPEDVVAHATDAGWTPEQTATALRKHRDNIATYAHDTEPAESSWKKVHQLDVDTEQQLQTVRSHAAGEAVAKVLPDPNERAQFAAQLEAGGYDPSAVDEQWQPAVQAWTQAANNPAFALPARGKPRKFMLGDQHLGSYREAPRSDGQSDHWFQPVSQDPAVPMKPFSVRLPTVTDDEVKAEVEKKQQELNDAADKWGTASEKLRKDSGSVAERDKWQEKTKQARAELDALKAHGKDMLTEQRLGTELADPKYAGKVGENHRLAAMAKGVADIGTGIANVFAYDADVLKSQPFLNSPLQTLQRMRSQGVMNGLASSVTGEYGTGARDAVKSLQGNVDATYGSSTRSQLEGGVINEMLDTATQAPAIFAQGILPMGFAATTAGHALAQTQQRADAARAAGDEATANRLEAGMGLHAALSGAVAQGAGHFIPSMGKSFLGMAAHGTAVPLAIGIAQRGLVDPVLGDHPDVFDPKTLGHELLSGLTLALPFAGAARLRNGAPTPPPEAGSPARSMDRESLTTAALTRFAELQHKSEGPVQGAKPADSLPADMRRDANLTPAERAEYDALHGALTTRAPDGSLILAPNHGELSRLYNVKLAGDHGVAPDSANVTEGSPSITADKTGGAPLDDAGSTPAVGTLNPGDVHPENGKTVEATFTGADGSRLLAYTDGTSETIAPDSKSPAPEEAAQNAATEAALAAGPKGLMDVAMRGGKVDSPRLQFSYKHTPDSLMGFPREGPTKSFEQQNYRHVQPVEVTFADGTSHVDAVKGLNREHAMERARRNWPGATIEPVSMQRLQLSRARGMPDGGKLPITDAPPVVPIPQVTVARHPAGMVEGLRQWLVSAKDDLLTRLKAKSPDAITVDFDKLKQYKSGENALHHFQAVAALPELYEHSRVAAVHADRADAKSGVRYERRYAWAMFPDGQRRHVLITSRLFHEANKPTKVYSLETMEVEVREAPLTYTDSAARETTKPSDQGAHPVKDGASVHEFLAGVKPEHRAEPSNNGAVPLSSRVKDTAKVAQEAARMLNQQLPGLVHDKVNFHANPEELLKSGYAVEHTFTPEEIADMQHAEAFFDTRTGHTIVFTDHIDVRSGESDRAAVARVILHERVGHDGFNHLYERDAQFKGTWDMLSAKIPEHELNAIAADYPQLAGDKNQLALEWFARAVEQRLHLQEGNLAQRLWISFKGLLQRIFSPFDKSLSAEQDLRTLIDKAREAAQNGTALPTTAEGLRLQFSLGGTRVMHDNDLVPDMMKRLAPSLRSKGNEPFRVNDLGTRTILTGSALPKAFHEAVQSTERERRALDQVSGQIGRDLNNAIESHAKRTTKPLTDVYDMVHQAMSGAPGTNAVLLQVDPVLAERARVARNFIDDMSVAVAQTLPAGPLRNNIVLNQGSWMRRTFAAFDAASGWNFDNVLKAARAGEQLAGKPAEQIVRDAAQLLASQNKYPAAMLDAKGLPVAGSVLEADMRDLMDRDTFANALTGSAAVRKNVSSLIARKDIPVELRTLMGEDTNPIKRFANSTAFQVQFLQRHAQQQTLRTIGLGNGLFSTTRGGVNTVEIPENHKWSPLAGLHTTPQLWEALQRVDGTERGNDFLAKMGEAVRWLGGEAKLNRVAMNPDSWAVNALGNVFALAQTGDLFSTTIFSRIAKAVALMKAGNAKSGDVVNATTEAITDANRAMVARLNAAGVLGETFSARDLEASLPRHLLQWIDQDASGLRDRGVGALKGALYGQAAGRGFGLTGRAVGGVLGGITGAVAGHERLLGLQKRIAEYVMTGPDALGRLTGFLGNLETAHAAGLTLQAAFDHAAERTRNTFPDYSKLPNVLRQLSRYGVAGSFIAFQYEVYRNTAWNLRYAYQDAKSGNTALQVRAAKRMVGASMLGYLAFGGMQAMFQQVVGADDDRNKTWRRWFAAPWEKHSVLAFTDYSDKGVSYFNTSYLVPQTTIAQLVKAATDGRDLGEAAGNVLGEVWDQFMGASVHIQPLIEAAMNVDRAGRPITFNDGITGAAERLDHAAQTILEPGWAGKIERLEYALREAERRGRTFSVEEEIKRFIGIRSFTRTWPDMVKRRYDKFAHDYSAIRSEANKTIGNNLPGAKLEAVATANAKIAALAKELAEYEADLPRLGVPTRLQETARRESTAPKAFHPLEVDPETGNRVRSQKH